MKKNKICIIGCGLTGTLLAAELLENSNNQIILIDVDRANDKFKINENLFNYYPFDKFSDVLTYALGYGGSSNLWHGVMTDFDNLDKKRLKHDYGLVELCNSKLTSLSYKIFPNIEKLFSNEESFSKKDNHWNKKLYYIPKNPFRLRNIIKQLSKKFPSRITLHQDSIAIDFNFNLNNQEKKVESINLISNNKRKTVKADIFISSAGALETPRLLKQSFDFHNIFSKHIGLNLLDHPFSCIGNILFNKKVFSKHGHPGFFSKYEFREGFSPKKLINNRNFSINLIPNINSVIDSFKNLKTVNKDKIYKLSAASVPYTTKLLFNYVRTNSYDIIFHHESIRTDNGYLNITNKFDSYGRRLLDYHYPDTSSLYENVQKLKSQGLLKSINKDYKKITIFSKKQEMGIAPASHYAGTCFASAFDKDSVCNENFKVRGFFNLYIADASVLPIIGSSNLSINLSRIAYQVSREILNSF